MKKCLSLLIALSLVLSMCVIPVSAADVDSYIFNETFENYTPDVNWVTGADANGYVTADGVQANAWTVAGTLDGASVKVVDGKTATGVADFTGGKVLEVNAGTATNWFAVKKNALNADGSYKVKRQVGKNLVYEAMIFIPSTFESAQNELSFLSMQSNDKPTNYKGSSMVFSHLGSTQWIARSSGQWNSTYYGRYTISDSSERPNEKFKGKWVHVRYVIDSAEDVANKDESDTSRFYMNDVLFTADFTHDPNANAQAAGKNAAFPYEIGDKQVDFHAGDRNTNSTTVIDAFPYRGTVFTVYNPSGKTNVSKYYIDDLQAYFVDQFAMGTPVNTENYVKGSTIEVPFNTEVKESFTEQYHDGAATKNYHTLNRVLANDLIKLTDAAGNVIENGIESATLSADKKTVEIVLSDEIEGKTDYKLAFAVEFRDVYGQGLNDHNKITTIDVHTAEALDILEAPEAIENLIPSDPRTFDIKFSAALASVTATLAGNDVTTQLLDENKTVRVKFTEVAAGDLVINATGTAGQAATLTIPVTVATGVKGADIINDDLSGLTVGTDLLADATGTSYYNGNFGFSIAKRTIAAIAFDAEGNKDKAEIVADPGDGTQGNVLKITNGTGGNTLAVNRMVDANRKASVNARGKVLIVESKYYLPAKTKWASGDYANYNGLGTNWGGENVSAYQRGSTNDTRILYIAQGQWNAYPGATGAYEGRYSRAEGTQTLPTGQWVTITNVYDLVDTATVTRPDTVRTYVDGVALGAKLKGTGAPTDLIYDLFPEGYYGEYAIDPATGELTGRQGSSRGPANVATYSGAATGITSRTNIPENSDAYVYYVDDYKVYTADDFTAEVVGNTTEYTPNQVVKILFNSQIPENQLAELYVVNKATGDKVEDATFTLANGGYAVDVKLPASVAKDEVYTVVAPTTFHDVTYQPLKNNLDWTFDITIGEYVPFKGTISETNFDSFVSGKGETKATLTLSKAVNSTAGIVVKNAEDAVVTEGWNASLSSDGKTIVLNFTNLPTANYTVDFAGLTAADGDAIVNADELAITITAKVEKIMIFKEDFEGTDYTLDADWIDNAPTNGKWDFSVGAAVADDFIGVVSADNLDATAHQGNTAFAGNVLKLYNTGGSSARVLTARAKSQIGAIDIEKDYPNKVIVYEADVYVKSTTDGSRLLTPSFASGAGTLVNFMKYNNGTAWKIEGGNIYMDFGTGKYSQAYKFQTGSTGTVAGLNSSVKASHNVIAVDQRKEVDTIKISANDVQYKSKDWTLLTDHVEFGTTNYEFPMNAFITAEKDFDAGDFQGILLHTYAKATAAEIYVDNIKAYLVDAFEIESIEGASTAFNMAKDTVKINFTNKVKSAEEAAANIMLVDAEGNEVKDAIAVALTGNDYQVSVTLNEKVVTGAQEYTLVVSPAIRDVYGVSLASEYYFYKYQPKATTQTGYLVKKDSNTVMLFATLEEAEAQKKVSGWTSATIIEYSWTYDEASGKVKAFNLTDPGLTVGTAGNDFLADTYTLDKNAMKLETVIKTTKATSLYAEATAAVVSGTNVSTSLTFTNPEEEALDVWYIVAAYGDYNEMIGCQAASIEVEKGIMDPIDINFTAKSSDIKSVKVYVWDGYKTMVPYQEAEELMK